jgi:hypothetical protein
MKICKYEITQMNEEDWHPVQHKNEMNQKGRKRLWKQSMLFLMAEERKS